MTASDAFVLTVTAANTAPLISDVSNQTIPVNGATSAVPFTVSDAETSAGSLVVTAASSNTTLVPVNNVVLAGSGGARTVRVTPAAGLSGTATITLTVSDGSLTASDAFVLTVLSVPAGPVPVQPPTGLSVIASVGNVVTLRWAAPLSGPAPTGYVLEGGTVPGQVLGSLPLGSASPVQTLTVPTGSWYLRVRVLSGGAVSGASNEVLVYVNVPVPPSPPANLLGLVVGSTVNLAWTPTFLGGAPTTTVLDVTGTLSGSLPLGLTDTFAFAGVPAGTYTFTVRARNASGTSVASNPVTLTFPGACSGAPQTAANFLAYTSGHTVFLNWDPPASGVAPTGYVLNVTGAFVTSVPTTQRALSGALPPGTYNLSVVSTNACGASAPTAVQAVTIP